MNRYIPPVTKNLLILNALFFMAKYFLSSRGINLDIIFGAFFPKSPNFNWYQVITHMFMHADLAHFFFNMFALWMFGSVVEQSLGAKKYLTLYFVCGLGSFVLFNLVNFAELKQAYDALVNENVPLVDLNTYAKLDYTRSYNYSQLANEWYSTLPPNTDATSAYKLFYSQTVPMVGASGAIYGLLVAFGVMFPNTVLMLIFPPIPIKAKYFIPIMVLLELYLGIKNMPGDNVAHFAHLGGALFGFLLTRHWLKNRYRWN